jgi:hypothetical protein
VDLTPQQHPTEEGWYIVQPSNAPAYVRKITARSAIVLPSKKTTLEFFFLKNPPRFSASYYLKTGDNYGNTNTE